LFDPDTAKSGLERGYSSCDPDDLPSDTPSRSLADNLHAETEITGKMRTEAFGVGNSLTNKVSAYKSAQLGSKPLGTDAEDDQPPTAGNYKDDGQ
jgi:hypothetical protein